jgi:hypothetical protein
VHNYRTPTADFGMFSSGSSGEPAVDTPYAPYYGYELASLLATKGATVSTLLLPAPDVYAYASTSASGGYSVMLVNANPSAASSIPIAETGLTGGSETEYVYDAANPTVASSAFSGSSVTVPAESIVVLTGGSGSRPTGSPTASTSGSGSASPSRSATGTGSASPSASATSGTPTTTPTGTGGTSAGCSAAWSLTNAWSGGFQLGFTVTNAGAAATHGWKVTWSWPGSQAVTQIWNSADTVSGSSVTATNLSYNGALSPGGDTTFGLLASGSPPSALSVSCTAT